MQLFPSQSAWLQNHNLQSFGEDNTEFSWVEGGKENWVVQPYKYWNAQAIRHFKMVLVVCLAQ